MSAPKDWQTTRTTIRERTTFMFNNHRFSDAKFAVRESNGKGGSESKKVIPAHKFVLSIGSPVFEAMFYGEVAETRAVIELPDCDHESLLELFRYLYSDEVNLSGSNVMGVLYLAKKYMVPSLADECSEFLLDNLHASNVFNILPMAQKYEEKELNDRCWKVIDSQSEDVTKSDGFKTIEHSLLETVVSRDTLTIKEVELFKAVDLWATKKCGNLGLKANGKVKRKILGEKVVKAIRFPVMKQEEFASVVPDTNILTPDEVINFFKFFSSAAAAPEEFSKIKRSGPRATSRVRGSQSTKQLPTGYSRGECQQQPSPGPAMRLVRGIIRPSSAPKPASASYGDQQWVVTSPAVLGQLRQPHIRLQQQNAQAGQQHIWECPVCTALLPPHIDKDQHVNGHFG
ncbi:BTB/POZ domain-containing protein 6-like [Acropora millepora]|uniref:BTB/POZ domain-containing protein 6-like n=1 Tax=Acropora millepora TaxID=45264 RepID=UPI001CF5A192|nr:BTB/POZ domain-containing protein 6-like [Acropora millepora]